MSRICGGTLLLGVSGCLGEGQPVSLLAFESGTTNVLGTLSVAESGSIEVRDGAVVRFGDSSAQTWAAGRRIDIVGRPNACEIRFGDSARALTADQMRMIRWNGYDCALDENDRLRRLPDGLLLHIR